MQPHRTKEDSVRHFFQYGQKGNTPAQRVTSSQWNTEPIRNHVVSSWHVPLKPDQLPRLLMGFRPREMEDKWFVYADGPDGEGNAVVHFHRSWTGQQVAEVILKVDKGENGLLDGSARITELVWESGEVSTKERDEEDIKNTVRTVCSWVLDVELQDGDEMHA